MTFSRAEFEEFLKSSAFGLVSDSLVLNPCRGSLSELDLRIQEGKPGIRKVEAQLKEDLDRYWDAKARSALEAYKAAKGITDSSNDEACLDVIREYYASSPARKAMERGIDTYIYNLGHSATEDQVKRSMEGQSAEARKRIAKAKHLTLGSVNSEILKASGGSKSMVGVAVTVTGNGEVEQSLYDVGQRNLPRPRTKKELEQAMEESYLGPSASIHLRGKGSSTVKKSGSPELAIPSMRYVQGKDEKKAPILEIADPGVMSLAVLADSMKEGGSNEGYGKLRKTASESADVEAAEEAARKIRKGVSDAIQSVRRTTTAEGKDEEYEAIGSVTDAIRAKGQLNFGSIVSSAFAGAGREEIRKMAQNAVKTKNKDITSDDPRYWDLVDKEIEAMEQALVDELRHVTSGKYDKKERDAAIAAVLKKYADKEHGAPTVAKLLREAFGLASVTHTNPAAISENSATRGILPVQDFATDFPFTSLAEHKWRQKLSFAPTKIQKGASSASAGLRAYYSSAEADAWEEAGDSKLPLSLVVEATNFEVSEALKEIGYDGLTMGGVGEDSVILPEDVASMYKREIKETATFTQQEIDEKIAELQKADHDFMAGESEAYKELAKTEEGLKKIKKIKEKIAKRMADKNPEQYKRMALAALAGLSGFWHEEDMSDLWELTGLEETEGASTLSYTRYEGLKEGSKIMSLRSTVSQIVSREEFNAILRAAGVSEKDIASGKIGAIRGKPKLDINIASEINGLTQAIALRSESKEDAVKNLNDALPPGIRKVAEWGYDEHGRLVLRPYETVVDEDGRETKRFSEKSFSFIEYWRELAKSKGIKGQENIDDFVAERMREYIAGLNEEGNPGSFLGLGGVLGKITPGDGSNIVRINEDTGNLEFDRTRYQIATTLAEAASDYDIDARSSSQKDIRVESALIQAVAAARNATKDKDTIDSLNVLEDWIKKSFKENKAYSKEEREQFIKEWNEFQEGIGYTGRKKTPIDAALISPDELSGLSFAELLKLSKDNGGRIKKEDFLKSRLGKLYQWGIEHGHGTAFVDYAGGPLALPSLERIAFDDEGFLSGGQEFLMDIDAAMSRAEKGEDSIGIERVLAYRMYQILTEKDSEISKKLRNEEVPGAPFLKNVMMNPHVIRAYTKHLNGDDSEWDELSAEQQALQQTLASGGVISRKTMMDMLGARFADLNLEDLEKTVRDELPEGQKLEDLMSKAKYGEFDDEKKRKWLLSRLADIADPKSELFNGKGLAGFSLRYPETMGYISSLINYVVDDGVGDDVVSLGPALLNRFNADFDGDIINGFVLPLLNAPGLSDEVRQQIRKAVESVIQKRKAEVLEFTKNEIHEELKKDIEHSDLGSKDVFKDTQKAFKALARPENFGVYGDYALDRRKEIGRNSYRFDAMRESLKALGLSMSDVSPDSPLETRLQFGAGEVIKAALSETTQSGLTAKHEMRDTTGGKRKIRKKEPIIEEWNDPNNLNDPKKRRRLIRQMAKIGKFGDAIKREDMAKLVLGEDADVSDETKLPKWLREDYYFGADGVTGSNMLPGLMDMFKTDEELRELLSFLGHKGKKYEKLSDEDREAIDQRIALYRKDPRLFGFTADEIATAADMTLEAAKDRDITIGGRKIEKFSDLIDLRAIPNPSREDFKKPSFPTSDMERAASALKDAAKELAIVAKYLREGVGGSGSGGGKPKRKTPSEILKLIKENEEIVDEKTGRKKLYPIGVTSRTKWISPYDGESMDSNGLYDYLFGVKGKDVKAMYDDNYFGLGKKWYESAVNSLLSSEGGHMSALIAQLYDYDKDEKWLARGERMNLFRALRGDKTKRRKEYDFAFGDFDRLTKQAKEFGIEVPTEEEFFEDPTAAYARFYAGVKGVDTSRFSDEKFRKFQDFQRDFSRAGGFLKYVSEEAALSVLETLGELPKGARSRDVIEKAAAGMVRAKSELPKSYRFLSAEQHVAGYVGDDYMHGYIDETYYDEAARRMVFNDLKLHKTGALSVGDIAQQIHYGIIGNQIQDIIKAANRDEDLSFEDFKKKNKEFVEAEHLTEEAYEAYKKAQAPVAVTAMVADERGQVKSFSIGGTASEMEAAARAAQTLQDDLLQGSKDFKVAINAFVKTLLDAKVITEEAAAVLEKGMLEFEKVSSERRAEVEGELRESGSVGNRERYNEYRRLSRENANYMAAMASNQKRRDLSILPSEKEALDQANLEYAEAIEKNHERMEQIRLAKNENGDVDLGLTVNPDELDKIDQLNAKLLHLKETALSTKDRGATNLWTELANSIRTLFYRFTQMGGVYRILGKIRQGFAKVIQSAQQLDKVMTNLRIVTGYNSTDAKNLMSDYANLAKTLSSTTAEVATSAQEWLRQGYEVAQVNDLVTSSIQLSVLGMMSASDATKALTSAMKGFKMETNEVSTIVDKFTALDMQAATSAGDIATALSKFATTAQMAGLDINQASAMATTIMDVSQSDAGATGNAIKTILSRYGNVKAGVFSKMGEGDSDDTTDKINDIERVLSVIGVRIRDSAHQMRDFDDVLGDIAAKWDLLDKVSQNAIATALAGTRQREAFAVLMNNYDKYQELLEVSQNSEGTAAKKYQSYLEQLEASQKRLQTAWEKLTQNTDIADFLKTINNFMAGLVEKLPFVLRYTTRLFALLGAQRIPQMLSMLNPFGSIGLGSLIRRMSPSGWGESMTKLRVEGGGLKVGGSYVVKAFENIASKFGIQLNAASSEVQRFGDALRSATPAAKPGAPGAPKAPPKAGESVVEPSEAVSTTPAEREEPSEETKSDERPSIAEPVEEKEERIESPLEGLRKKRKEKDETRERLHDDTEKAYAEYQRLLREEPTNYEAIEEAGRRYDETAKRYDAAALESVEADRLVKEAERAEEERGESPKETKVEETKSDEIKPEETKSDETKGEKDRTEEERRETEKEKKKDELDALNLERLKNQRQIYKEKKKALKEAKKRRRAAEAAAKKKDATEEETRELEEAKEAEEAAKKEKKTAKKELESAKKKLKPSRKQRAYSAIAGGISGALTATQTGNGSWLGLGGEYQLSESAGVASRVLTGTATAIGSIWGPAVGMIAGAVMDGLTKYIIMPIVDRTYLERQRRMKESQEMLNVVQELGSATQKLKTMAGRDSSQEDYLERRQAVEDILAKLYSDEGKKTRRILEVKLTKIIAGQDTSLSEQITLNDAMQMYLEGDAATQKRIALALEIAEEQTTAAATFGTLEERLKKVQDALSEKKIGDYWGFSPFSTSIPGAILSSTYGDLGFTSYNEDGVADLYQQAGFAVRSTSAGDDLWGKLGEGFLRLFSYGLMSGVKRYLDTSEMNLEEQIEAFTKLRDFARKRIDEGDEDYGKLVSSTESILSELKDIKVVQEKIYKEMNGIYTKSAFLSTSIGYDSFGNERYLADATTRELKRMGIERIRELIARELYASGGLMGHDVYTASGEITAYAKKEIDAYLKTTDLYSIATGTAYTLREAALLDEGETKDQVVEMISNSMNLSKDEVRAQLSDETSMLLSEFGDMTVGFLSETMTETRNRISELTSLFDSLASSMGLTAENLETIIEKTPELLRYVGDDEGLAAAMINNLEAYKKSYALKTVNSVLSNQGVFNEFDATLRAAIGEDAYGRLIDGKTEAGRIYGSATTLNDMLSLMSSDPAAIGLDPKTQETIKKLYEDFFDGLDTDKIVNQKIAQTMTSYLSKSYEKQIENLNEQKQALQDINKQREYENRLIEARNKLEAAGKEKKRVWREGVGWTYEADQEAIAEAQKNLDSVQNEKKVDDLQLMIDYLEGEKKFLDDIASKEEFENLEAAYKAWVESNGDVLTSQTAIMERIHELYTGKTYDATGKLINEKKNTTISGAANAAATRSAEEAAAAEKAGGNLGTLFKDLLTAKKNLDKADPSSSDYEDIRNKYDEALDKFKKTASAANGSKAYRDFFSPGKDASSEDQYRAQQARGALNWEESQDRYYDFLLRLDNGPGGLKRAVIDLTRTAPYGTEHNIQGDWGNDNQSDNYKGAWLDLGRGETDFTKANIIDPLEFREKYSGNLQTWMQAQDNGADGYLLFGGKDDIAYVHNRLLRPVSFEKAADGSLGLRGGLSLVNEEGPEAIVTPYGTLTSLPSGTGVVPADATRNLWALGEIAPALLRYLDGMRASEAYPGSGSAHEGDSFSIGVFNMNVTPNGEFDVEAWVRQVKQAVAAKRGSR